MDNILGYLDGALHSQALILAHPRIYRDREVAAVLIDKRHFDR